MINLLQIPTSDIFYLFITLGISLVIFLALRALMLWYWKVDKVVNNQERQIQQQSIIIEKLCEIIETNNNNKRA